MMEGLLQSVDQLVSQGGYPGVFVAMLVENFLQFIPSEAIMPLAGFLVFEGKLGLLPTILAGTAGTILGTLPWYWIGRAVNEEKLEAYLSRHGTWFGITSGKLRKSRQWFNRYGVLIVFWGRLVPILRTLVSIPAGMEMMPWRSFLLWTSLGSLIWNAALTVAGYKLGENWERVHALLRPFTLLAAFSLLPLPGASTLLRSSCIHSCIQLHKGGCHRIPSPARAQGGQMSRPTMQSS